MVNTTIQVFPNHHVILYIGDEAHLLGELHENTLVVKKDPKKHLMRKWNAYGFNAQVLKELPIEFIVIDENDEFFQISTKQVFAAGQYFKEEGQEPQYFVDRELFQKL